MPSEDIVLLPNTSRFSLDLFHIPSIEAGDAHHQIEPTLSLDLPKTKMKVTSHQVYSITMPFTYGRHDSSQSNLRPFSSSTEEAIAVITFRFQGRLDRYDTKSISLVVHLRSLLHLLSSFKRGLERMGSICLPLAGYERCRQSEHAWSAACRDA
jgi:hypothetical protein